MGAPVGRIGSLTVWPVKSTGGGRPLERCAAGAGGLRGDRAFAFADERPARAGHVVSARNVPGLLRWSARWPDGPGEGEPLVLGPDGQERSWSDPALAVAVSDDVGVPLRALPRGRYADLADSVLVTTQVTHEGVEELFGRPLEAERWRTNVHLETGEPAFAESGWEGRRLVAGDVVLRLLHPCRRCTIPTWAPGGTDRTPELLRWFHREHAGRFGINARVEVPGVLEQGAPFRWA